MINEATYRLASAIDKIYKNVIKNFLDAPLAQKKRRVNITNYLNTFIKKYSPITKVYLIFVRNPSKEGHLAEIDTIDTKRVKIKLYNVLKTKYSSKRIKSDLTHEITHLIDEMQREWEEQSFPKKYDKTDYGFIRKPDELNAIIHELKRYRKNNLRNYNSVENVEDFIDFLQDSENDSLIILSTVMSSKKWLKKIMLRINRENLLPILLRSKVNEKNISSLLNKILINEATYEFSNIVNKIFKNIIKPYLQKPNRKVKYIDITEYVENLIKKYSNKIKVYLRMSQNNSPEKGLAFLVPNAKKAQKFTIWLYELYEKKITNSLINEIKNNLTHEITHLIDILRRKQKFQKRGGYLRLSDEMNAAIHELKAISKRNKKRYNRIYNFEDFIDYLDDSKNDSLIRLGDYIKKPKWRKKIVLRLYKENLLPPAIMMVSNRKMNLPENMNMNNIEKIKKLWEAKKKKKLKPGEKRFIKSILKKKNPKESEMLAIDKIKEKEEKTKLFKDIIKRAKRTNNPDAYKWGTLRKIMKRKLKKKGKNVKPE